MTKTTKNKVTVSGLDQASRLDRVLRERVPGLGRRAAQSLINAKKVRVNGRMVWICSWKVKNGDVIEMDAELPEKQESAEAFDDAWIVRKEADVVAVNKPAGMLSHKTRAKGRADMLALAGERFGPVALFHRLDRDTSGVLLFTWPGPINRYLDTAFKEQSIEKLYLACVADAPGLANSGTIRARMTAHPKRRERMMVAEQGGKKAESRYEVVARADGRALVKLWPMTGRTHQLRVHMQYIGSPIFGDPLYGPKPLGADRLMLHAFGIALPDLDGFPERRFSAPLPDDFLRNLPHVLRQAALELNEQGW